MFTKHNQLQTTIPDFFDNVHLVKTWEKYIIKHTWLVLTTQDNFKPSNSTNVSDKADMNEHRDAM